MVRLTLEEVLDLPYPSILAYLRSKDRNLSQGYENEIITAIIFYKRDYLLRGDDEEIIMNADFVRTFQLSNTELIRMMNQKENISIFTTKAKIIRSLLFYEGKVMTFGRNKFGQFRSYYGLQGSPITSESIVINNVYHNVT